MDIIAAIMFIIPQAKWHLDGDGTNYENLVWDDLFYPKPTKEELETAYKYSKLGSQFDYRLKRLEHYPTAEQQLDIIFDIGIDGWKSYIQNIKDNIPKPEIN
jgi:hypothetical protein